VHGAEVEAGGLLDVVHHVRVVLGVDAGELDLDAVLAHGADHGLGDAEGIDAGGDDVDGLGKLLLAGVLGQLGGGRGVNLERDGDAALKVETELELALRAREQLGEEDGVPLLDVLQFALELDDAIVALA